MAKENIKKLEEALRADEALRAKYKETVEAIKAEGKTPSESELKAEVATRLGYPVTAEEIDQAKASGQALSDEELDAVAGGKWCWSGDTCLLMDANALTMPGGETTGGPSEKKLCVYSW